MLRGAAMAKAKVAAAILLTVGVAGAGAMVLTLGEPPPTRSVAQDADRRPILESRPPSMVDRIQEGPWIVEAGEHRGAVIPGVAGDVLHIKGDRFVWVSLKGGLLPLGKTVGVVKLDPRTDPPRIDLTGDLPESPGFVGKSLVLRGIFRRDGDRLTLCLGSPKGGPRPQEFATDRDGTQILVTLRLGEPSGRGK
jgi:uncharacterized protein (TIGR03067 family)